MKNIIDRIWDSSDFVPVILFVVVLAALAAAIVGAASNALCEIDCGIIVDKHISTINRKVPVCRFTIEGYKYGIAVQYTFAVTEYEYDQYSIGDYYDKTKGQ